MESNSVGVSLAELVRFLPSNHKVLGSTPDSAEI